MYSPCSVQLLGHSTVTVDTLQELKRLDLSRSSVTDVGIRGLELIPTLEVLNLVGCRRTTNVSFLQRCCALKKLDLSSSNVTDRGIHGLELIPTLEELDLSRCLKLHDLSALRNRPGLQIVGPDIMLPF
jgi:Leucine-rich repeat (LRR) protein